MTIKTNNYSQTLKCNKQPYDVTQKNARDYSNRPVFSLVDYRNKQLFPNMKIKQKQLRYNT